MLFRVHMKLYLRSIHIENMLQITCQLRRQNCY